MQFNRKILVFAFLLFSSLTIKAQSPDLIVGLKESVLNKMFAAIGEIKGTSVYSFMFVEGTYNWTLIKPQIKLHPNKANFETEVKVKAGKFEYTTKVNGIVEICYEPTTNLIYVEITEALFPLNILFMGKQRHLWDVNLKSSFETPFTFEGPLTMGTEMIFAMPDGTSKTIYCHPINCGVKIAEKQIIVSAETEFVERVITPIPANKK
ncbi:MAG TPA: hypothetical protein VJI69_04285 [Bacteroidia bacterium]|nr:hypothetical protein [Bacteroidia bacterium]